MKREEPGEMEKEVEECEYTELYTQPLRLLPEGIKEEEVKDYTQRRKNESPFFHSSSQYALSAGKVFLLWSFKAPCGRK